MIRIVNSFSRQLNTIANLVGWRTISSLPITTNNSFRSANFFKGRFHHSCPPLLKNDEECSLAQKSNYSILSPIKNNERCFQPALDHKSNYSSVIKNDEKFLQLALTRKSNYSLPVDFYGQSVHDTDMKHIWSKSWLFAGLSIEIPKKNDYIVYNVGRNSVIISRGINGKVHAYHNVCRHRGSRLCTEEKGNMSAIVCPYHQWVYHPTTGLLKYARDMGSKFDEMKHSLSLIPAHVREFHGFIFVSMREPYFEWEECVPVLSPQLAPHRFDKAKIAFTKKYEVNCNWKMVYENNRECYHCNKSHPEYIRANYDTTFSYQERNGEVYRVPDINNPGYQEALDHIDYLNRKWKRQLNIECSSDSRFPGSGWYRASRSPNKKGWPIESLDGQSVCKKLMGNFTDLDMGSMRMHTLPNHWTHASADHAVVTRLTPLSWDRTEVVTYWLVHEDAIEGIDYDHDKLTTFWHLTNLQDWKLSEINHLGVHSPHYCPGPLSPTKERNLERFIDWYISSTKAMIEKNHK